MSDLRAGIRRSLPADLSDVGEHEGLAARIREEIRRAGPMPFARFMELALYDPDGGYYRGPDARPGRGGDFLTAPELHPIFGEMVGRAVVDAWEVLGRPDPFVVTEHGAGEGALAVPMLRDAPAAIRYRPVEVDDRRRSRLDDRLREAGLADRLIETDAFEGMVLANEVLDALPVHRVRRRTGRLRELAVDLRGDGSFLEVEIDPTTPELVERLVSEGIELAEGQTAELSLTLADWIAGASAPLRRGVLLVIDYGHPAPELYDSTRRRDGTLRAYVRHHASDDPYRFVGRQDLTAHVDITAVERAANAAGLRTLGITTQAEALMGLGIEERLREIQADPATSIEDYTLLRSALMRLLDPAAMGRFRFMLFGRGWPPKGSTRLLGYRLPVRS